MPKEDKDEQKKTEKLNERKEDNENTRKQTAVLEK